MSGEYDPLTYFIFKRFDKQREAINDDVCKKKCVQQGLSYYIFFCANINDRVPLVDKQFLRSILLYFPI